MVAAGIFILLLSRENIKLQKEKTDLEARVLTLSGELAGPPSAQVGDIVPPFEAVSLDGKQVSIVYNGSSKYLLYVFSTECGACVSQLPVWDKIAAQPKSKDYKKIAVSTESVEDTRASLSDKSFNFDILVMPNESIRRAYRVVAEPMVMIVSAEGKVEWVHYGTLTQNTMSELSSILGFNLRDVL
jgi:peroxiredoxin